MNSQLQKRLQAVTEKYDRFKKVRVHASVRVRTRTHAHTHTHTHAPQTVVRAQLESHTSRQSAAAELLSISQQLASVYRDQQGVERSLLTAVASASSGGSDAARDAIGAVVKQAEVVASARDRVSRVASALGSAQADVGAGGVRGAAEAKV